MSQFDFSYLYHRPIAGGQGEVGVSGTSNVDDIDLVKRIHSNYRNYRQQSQAALKDIWNDYIGGVRKEDEAKLAGSDVDAVAKLLRDPATNKICFGFDELFDHSILPNHPLGVFVSSPLGLHDNLLRLAEAIGVRRKYNPERIGYGALLPPVEEILTGLDAALGTNIVFPNPFPAEAGLVTSRGIASYRAIQAVYQAYRLVEVAGRDARVIEIGGGMGRTAFYAHALGIRNYTIFDLPLTNVMQSYFLGRTLGAEAVAMDLESVDGIRVLPYFEFFEESGNYDICLNVDSLTEIDRGLAEKYCNALLTRAPTLLSINHESNAFTAREICLGVGMRSLLRMPYWLRRGYVEEIFKVV
jgi:hypothetical protein